MTMALVISSALGSALVLAALAKVPTSARRTSFLERVGVPRRSSHAVTDVGVVLEGVTGACLIANVESRVAAPTAALLMLAFLVLQIVARVRRVQVPCGCYGVLDQASHPAYEIARTSVFVGVAVWTLRLAPWNSSSGFHTATLVGAAIGSGVILAASNVRYAVDALRVAQRLKAETT
jgi:Methylamine utilisation protein MauE